MKYKDDEFIKINVNDIDGILAQYNNCNYRYEIIGLLFAFIKIRNNRGEGNIIFIDDDELMQESGLTLGRFQRARKELQLFSIDTLCAWKPNPWKEIPEYVKYTYNITF